MEGDHYLFPARHKSRLLSTLEDARKVSSAQNPNTEAKDFLRSLAPQFGQLWLELVAFPSRPKLVTPGGDALQFVTARFEVRDFANLETALGSCPELHREPKEEAATWTWFEELEADMTRRLGQLQFENGVLTLETQSMQRTERGEALLLELLGEDLGPAEIEVRDPWELSGSRDRPDADCSSNQDAANIPAELKDQLIRDHLERHYRSWPDVPLPALSGKSPRAAAKLEAWRPRVIDLLQEFENSEARSPTMGGAPYDFTWLWQELGLERPSAGAGAG